MRLVLPFNVDCSFISSECNHKYLQTQSMCISVGYFNHCERLLSRYRRWGQRTARPTAYIILTTKPEYVLHHVNQ